MNLNLPKIEQKILNFWKKNKIFEKSLEKTKKCPRFVFYEGPPFANGLPGIHHLLARAFKDIILRYKTMQGFYVERKAGWDTHGLPTEMEAEKKLGIKSKKEIEKLGIEKFIKECKRNVFTYKKEWEEFTERIGFWLDLKNAYVTCSNKYIETLWWILKKIWEKGLLYQDYKVVPYCSRCGTSLSSHEVAQGYKTIKENAVTVKFELVDEPRTYILAWTTTPWTLPANVALAVNPEIDYLNFHLKNYPVISDGNYITSKKDFEDYKEEIEKNKSRYGAIVKIIDKFKGKDLVGKEYKPLYPFNAPYKVIAGGFVSTEEGTGVVHIAPAFGEDDMKAGKENNLPILMTVDEEGKFKSEIKNWAGMFVKSADPLIIEDLKKRNLLFKEELYEHEYPFCWRCETPLLYYAKTSWFIKMTALKNELIKNNQKINWIPEYLKEGRFGEWLREVKDWNLSRERYWGTPLPIWQCQSCNTLKVIGSIKELENLSSKKIKEIHRPFIDRISFKCEKCGGMMKRVPEVVDCWFDSGSMPFAQGHWPFAQNQKSKPPELFPSDFICEGIDQTRGWFYTLLAISTLLGLGPSYKNVISHGIVLDAKGQKMSKSKGNVIWPKDVIDKYGADCARFHFYTINPVGEPKRFDFREVEGLSRRFFDTLWNSFIFFETYGLKKSKCQNPNLLDQWIISRLNTLNQQITKNLEKYDVVGVARLFDEFLVDDLSNWYIRRSRRRFQKPENLREKTQASQTLYQVLLTLTKLLAPFTPFIAEEIYQKIRGLKPNLRPSVHLEEYPKPNKKLINQKLEEMMKKAREIVALALAERVKAGIKVRQPLSELRITNYELRKEKDLLDLIKEEVNVKKITFGKSLKLDAKITPQLKEEGIIREAIRQIQEMRKKAGLKPKDKILIRYFGEKELNDFFAKNKKTILKETQARDFSFGKISSQKFKIEKELEIDKKKLWLGVKI